MGCGGWGIEGRGWVLGGSGCLFDGVDWIYLRRCSCEGFGAIFDGLSCPGVVLFGRFWETGIEKESCIRRLVGTQRTNRPNTRIMSFSKMIEPNCINEVLG